MEELEAGILDPKWKKDAIARTKRIIDVAKKHEGNFEFHPAENAIKRLLTPTITMGLIQKALNAIDEIRSVSTKRQLLRSPMWLSVADGFSKRLISNTLWDSVALCQPHQGSPNPLRIRETEITSSAKDSFHNQCQ